MAALAPGCNGRDLLRVATAGSVDDGKSTLIGRLLHDAGALYEDQVAALAGRGGAAMDLAWVTDGLKAEREQGITIDVAYRYFETPQRRFILADTPGHEQYTRNMATGASTADVAVVLIDVTRGAGVQSRRHGFIASLLGVPRLIVAVNKMDLAAYSEQAFAEVRAEYGAFAARLGFRDIVFIPVSALHGDNVVRASARMPWYPGITLLNQLENLYSAGDRNLIDLRFVVQQALRPDASFRGYAGQVASGVLRAGDEIAVAASGARAKVARIATFDGDLEAAFPPMSVTVALDTEIDVGRGDVLAHPNNQPRVTRQTEAMVVWMNEAPLKPGATYLLQHAGGSVRASCAHLGYRVNPATLRREAAAQLELNEIGRIGLELFRPLAIDEYARNRATGGAILIDPDTCATVGAVMFVARGGARMEAPEAAQAARNLTWQAGRVGVAQREALLGQKPATLWLTGLSGAGKSTIAAELEQQLMAQGRACFILDGDNLRQGINRDLDFSPHARSENIRRAAEVAHLMNEAGLIVICALISPYAEDRAAARAVIGEERFLEVHVATSLAVCEARDVRGLYRKARAGLIADFTGVSAPYEVPAAPALAIDTANIGVTEAARAIAALLPRIGAEQ
ncbi:MAG TPA: adenylyl-sulfate kinase [Burkholderiales bacterium]